MAATGRSRDTDRSIKNFFKASLFFIQPLRFASLTTSPYTGEAKDVAEIEELLAPPVKGERASLLARGLFLKKGGGLKGRRGLLFKIFLEQQRQYRNAHERYDRRNNYTTRRKGVILAVHFSNNFRVGRRRHCS